MEKYKVCPSCGEHNKPDLFECQSCETDLTGIRIVDEASEKLNLEKEPSSGAETKTVRICECGEANPSQARKCISCGEDISDIQPSSVQANPVFSLNSLDGLYAFEIDKPICTIGREQDMAEYLSSKPYVSRTHAKITLMNNEMYIENMSKTNFTYINNKKIENDIPQLLKDGDEIGLGGMMKNGSRQDNAAYFIVRICSCT